VRGAGARELVDGFIVIPSGEDAGRFAIRHLSDLSDMWLKKMAKDVIRGFKCGRVNR
jgi:hypothetical protein